MSSRTGARILLTFGFLAAAIAYNGWIATRTVLDPGATKALAHALFDTRTVQDHLETQLTAQVDQELAQHNVDPKVAEAVRQAVRDPRVADAFATAVEEAHAALLADSNDNITLDTSALTGAVHDALAARDPALAAELARRAPVHVEFDGRDLPHLGHARDAARTLMVLGAIAALCLVTASLLLRRDRRAVGRLGRRIAYLAFTPLLLFVVLPRVVSSLLGDDGDAVGAALRAYGPRVMPSAIALVVIGCTVALGALLMPSTPDHTEAPPPRPPHPNSADHNPAPAPPAPVEPRITERLYL